MFQIQKVIGMASLSTAQESLVSSTGLRLSSDIVFTWKFPSIVFGLDPLGHSVTASLPSC